MAAISELRWYFFPFIQPFTTSLFLPYHIPCTDRHYSLFHQHKQSDNYQDVAAVAGGFPLYTGSCSIYVMVFFSRYSHTTQSIKNSHRAAMKIVLLFRQDKHQDIVQYRQPILFGLYFLGLALATLRSTLPVFCLRSSQQYNALLEIPDAFATWMIFLHLSRYSKVFSLISVECALRTRQKKQNPLKNIAKCKFYDDAHHAKFQRVFRHLRTCS